MSQDLMWYVDTMPNDSYCWEWTGGKTTAGYGSHRGKYAHRMVYERYVGEIHFGMQIDHLCRNRSCVKPSHLEQVTQAENLRRGYGLHRVKHCRKGHRYTPQNTRVLKGKWRGCKECHRQQERKRYHAAT